MSKFTSDIVIAYRIYPKVTKPTFVHSDDKLKLARLGLRSLVRSLDRHIAELFVILDGCPQEYSQMVITEVPSNWKLEIVTSAAIGNKGTFGLQLEILSKAAPGTLLMFAEDDYCYKEGALSDYITQLKGTEWDYATPYRHPDMSEIPHWRRLIEKWNRSVGATECRRIPATCMTFLCRNSNSDSLNPLSLYTKRNCDADVWLALTASWREILMILLRSYIGRDKMFVIIARAAMRAKFNIGLRRRKLVEPISNVGTHAETKYLAHGENWKEIARRLGE